MRDAFLFRHAAGLLTLLFAVCLAPSVPAQDSVSGALDKLLARLPVDTAAKRDEIVGRMLKLGEPGVRELCGRIRNEDEPLDGKVCAALHGLVHAAARTGAEDVRRLVADVFGEVLRSEATIAAKSHLINELRTLGRAESVGPVSALLEEDDLCETAAQTLVAIGGAEAAAALREALPKLKGKGRVTVAFALGRMRDRAAVPLLLKEAVSADPAVRHAALFALADIGDPSAEAVLRKAVAANDAGECEQASHRLLRFARRLAENGHKPQAIHVCRSLLSQPGATDSGLAPGAFYELMGLLEKDEALTDLLAGIGHRNAKVRTAAIRAASGLPGADVTAQLARALVTLPPDRRAPVVELLRQRGDPAALEFVVQALKDPDKNVRIAAMAAVGGLGKRDVAPQLIAFLDQSPEESGAARSALTTMGDKSLNEALVKALAKATPDARCGLLAVLAGRDAAGHRDVFLSCAEDPDGSVRHAALKILGALDDEKVVAELMRLLAKTADAAERTAIERSLLEACRHLSSKSHRSASELLINGYREAGVPVRCALVNAVACMAKGYPTGLAHVRAARNDEASALRDVALRALAEWPSAEPMDELLAVARDTGDTTEHVLALRGCIRMAGQVAMSTREDDRDKAIKTLGLAMAATRRVEEKRRVLGAVSALAHPEALALAARCLDDPALSAEAKAAAVKIGLAMCQPTRALVAYDKRASALPDWLKSWRDTGTLLQTTDTGFKIYANVASENTITLGGNKAPGAASQYIVILTGLGRDAAAAAPAMEKALQTVKNDDVRRQLEQLIGQTESSDGRPVGGAEFHVAKVASGAACKVIKNGLKDGAKVYIDRNYTFKETPAELRGATYVMMANNDKNRTGQTYLTLRTGEGRDADTDDTETASPESGSPVRVVLGGELVTEYHYADADRPYFYPVIAPTGDNITRHWPLKDINKDEQQDHKHQRSLWFTHGAVNGHDFWGEGAGPKIVQTKMKVQSGDSRCVIISENEWRAKDGRVVCTDVRRHTIRLSGDSRIIDFAITIRASHGKVVLGDTKEGSMAVRVAPTLRANGKVAKGSMVNSEGGSGKGIWGKRATWCDYYGPINGKTVGIAIMDHPDNPRHPTWWHARDYGLCAANPFGLSYFEKKPKGTGDMTVEEGQSVTFRYRVLVHNGTAAEADIATRYQEYATGPEPQPIFNGRDFTGWTVPKDNTWWQVRDGIIACESGPKKKGSTLWTEKRYRDFIISLDFRFGAGTVDSGIFLRTTGQQVQIGISGSLKRDMTGSVYVPGKGYPLEAEGVKELLKPKDWNAMKVRAEGNVYTIWLNGKQILVFEAEKAPEEGPIGLQLHPGKTMAIDFRDIKLAELE